MNSQLTTSELNLAESLHAYLTDTRSLVQLNDARTFPPQLYLSKEEEQDVTEARKLH